MSMLARIMAKIYDYVDPQRGKLRLMYYGSQKSANNQATSQIYTPQTQSRSHFLKSHCSSPFSWGYIYYVSHLPKWIK